MKKLDKDEEEQNINCASEEGQRASLSSNTDSSCCPSSGTSDLAFSPEAIKSLVEFGKVLRRIHNRLLSEGYTISNGEITKPTTLHNHGHTQ